MGRYSVEPTGPVGPVPPVMAHPVEIKLRDLGMLGELCRWVARTDPGVVIGLRDAIPRLELSFPGGLVADVRVDEDGQVFVCRPSFRRYPTRDMAAAAVALAAFVRSAEHHGGQSDQGGGAG